MREYVLFSGANSGYLIAAHRLGMDIPEEITMDMFEDILYFDTPATRMAVANAAHESAESVLRQIERAVRIVDSSRQSQDNVAVRNDTRIPTAERMVEYGNQMAGNPVQRGRERYAGADDRVPEAAGGQYRQIRRAAPTVHDGVAQGDLSADDSERNAEEAPDGDQRTGEPDVGSADLPPDENKSQAPDKATNQMGWVQHMNCLKAQAEEIVLDELIYV